jgi:hypothetical protein
LLLSPPVKGVRTSVFNLANEVVITVQAKRQ